MNKEKKQLLLGMIGICVGIVIVVAPCTIRNYSYSHKFILISSNGPINFWIGNNPDAVGTYYLSPYAAILREKEQKDGDKIWTSDAINFIKERPKQYINLLFKKLCLFWGAWEPPDNDVVYERFKENCPLLRMPFVFVFGIIAPLGLVGMIFSIRRWWGKASLLYLISIIYMLATIAFFVQARFRVPIIPYLSIFAGFAIWYFYEAIKVKRYHILCSFIPILIIVYLLTNFQTYFDWTYPFFHPNGTIIESRKGIIVRDDSGEWHGSNIRGLDLPNKIIKKELIINKTILKIKYAELIITYFANDKGSLLIEINGKKLPKIPCSCITYGRFQREAKLEIESEILKEGLNTIIFRVTEEANIQIPVDNRYNYKRSFFSEDGINWKKIEGEFLIRLELKENS